MISEEHTAAQSNIVESITEDTPKFSLNLQRRGAADPECCNSLVVLGKGESPPKQHLGEAANSNGRARRESNASFFGESWYASYLLSTAATSYSELHQPVEENHEIAVQGVSNMPDSHQSSLRSSSGEKDMPPRALRDRLIEAYFSRFHLHCPILDRSPFLQQVHDGNVSCTLLRCVLFVGSYHCNPEVFHLMGHSTRLEAGDNLFQKAKASFDADNTSDRITMLLSSFLLHYFWGQPTTFRDCLWWLSSAVRSAQCMGMHRSTKNSKMSEKSKAAWRRIWWCLYVSAPLHRGNAFKVVSY